MTSPHERDLISTPNPPPSRSTLPKDEARQRYVEIGELVALEQIKKDSETLDHFSIAVGPFARLDANVVAAREGKTRGAITNLFGSQASFQAATMALALHSRDWIEQIQYPAPDDYPNVGGWLDAFFTAESERGPHMGADPSINYGSVWALWLSAVPYGLWSEEIRRPSMEEHTQWLEKLDQILQEAMRRFGSTLRKGVAVRDLASAFASLIEGVWLNQCMTANNPSDDSEPIAASLRRSGELLWVGATETNQNSSTSSRDSGGSRNMLG
jgi:hypothetical protein